MYNIFIINLNFVFKISLYDMLLTKTEMIKQQPLMRGLGRDQGH